MPAPSWPGHQRVERHQPVGELLRGENPVPVHVHVLERPEKGVHRVPPRGSFSETSRVGWAQLAGQGWWVAAVSPVFIEDKLQVKRFQIKFSFVTFSTCNLCFMKKRKHKNKLQIETKEEMRHKMKLQTKKDSFSSSGKECPNDRGPGSTHVCWNLNVFWFGI